MVGVVVVRMPGARLGVQGVAAVPEVAAREQPFQEGFHVRADPKDGVGLGQRAPLGGTQGVCVGTGSGRHQRGDLNVLRGDGAYQQFQRFDGGDHLNLGLAGLAGQQERCRQGQCQVAANMG